MQVSNSVYPNETQIQEFSDPGPNGPIHMVNLLRFRARAEYPDGRDSDLTGEQAYGIYTRGVTELLKEHGGALTFAADVERLVLGEVEDLWDKVAIARYPSRAAMREMAQSPRMQEIGVHRAAGLAGQLNIETAGPSVPGSNQRTSTEQRDMAEATYTPPKVWTWDKESGGRFANINRPIAGATHEAELPVGEHPLQLYSLATPNGVKVTMLLEELLEAGADAEYDAYLINIGDGSQFGSGFVAINPNSKIPALLDRGTPTPTRVFESGAILLYLAEKFGMFLPTDPSLRAECLSWLFWQMGSAPYLGGGFGHFYAYAPEKIEYPIDRYAMEVKRQTDVLNRRLDDNAFLCGDEYTIADMANYAWYGALVLHNIYDAAEFLDVASYANVVRWAESIESRPAVARGRRVNRPWGPEELRVAERHSASDFDH